MTGSLTALDKFNSVMETLIKMATHSITGLPIVDKDKKVIGNFSSSDIRSFQHPSDFKLLSDHVKSFIGSEHRGK